MADTLTRDVLWNGAVVGQVSASGDDLKDLESSVVLLKELGLYVETSLVDRMFSQAASFASAADLLMRNIQIDKRGANQFGTPFVVNMAFSIELYLKTLAQVHGVSLRKHDLLTLYGDLPESARQAAEAHMAEGRARYSLGPSVTFASALLKARSAFVEWRYSYELDRPTSVFPMQEMMCVGFALHAACVESGKIVNSKV